MISILLENFYFINLVFSVGITSLLLIYLSRFSPEDPRTGAFQRMLLCVFGWAVFDFAVNHAHKTYSPRAAFDLYRYLSILFLLYPPASGELIISLMRRVGWKDRVLLFLPYILLYLAALAAPSLVTARTFEIPGGYSGAAPPWNTVFKVYTVGMIVFLLIKLGLHGRREPDPMARREMMILCLGGFFTIGGILAAQVAKSLSGPGFPWMAHLSTYMITLAAFWGLRQYGRVLSPRALYETTIRMTPNGIIHLRDGRITWVNPGMLELLEVKKSSDIEGRPVEDLIDREATDINLIKDIVDRLSNGLVRNEEVPIKADNGRSLVCLAGGAPFDPGDKTRGAMVVFTDISRIKQAEEALRESEEKFYKAFRSNPGAVSISRFDEGRYVEVNQGFIAMYGYERDEVIGRTAEELNIWGDRPEQGERRMVILREQETIRDFEFSFRRKNGEIGSGINSAEIIDLNGNPHILSASIDITERNRAVEALRESEEKYRTILESTAIAITITELSTGEFIEVNKGFTHLTGYERDEAIGRTVFELELFFERRARKKMVEMLRDHGEILGYPILYVTKDGRHVDTILSARTIRYAGVECMVSVVQDVSMLRQAEREQERLQARLQQARKMEAVGTLAGGIAHDFNNILQAISGYIQLIHNTRNIAPKILDYLNEIDKAERRAAELVQRLLTFSREVEPTLRPVDLNLTVDQSVKILERTIPKMVAIEKNLAEDLKPINADPTQMEQVLINLGANARDAMPDGGRLLFETSAVEVDQEFRWIYPMLKANSYNLLKVSDTGQGMDSETQKNVFDPFYTTKEIGKGTGLGLAMVYGIVQSHGGHVSFVSEPGKGTVFSVYLPVMEGVEAPPPQVPGEDGKIPGGSETILLVDDETPIIESARELLELSGYNVLVAASGEEALDIYHESGAGIELVILDLSMPGMGGRACLRRLLEADPGVKVIISSGYAEEGRKKQYLESGARGFVGKPYRASEMLKMIREVLDE